MQAAELLDCLLSTESQSDRFTTYPLHIWLGETFMPILNKLKYSLCSQGDKNFGNNYPFLNIYGLIFRRKVMNLDL